jgi:hypothetical protein
MGAASVAQIWTMPARRATPVSRRQPSRRNHPGIGGLRRSNSASACFRYSFTGSRCVGRSSMGQSCVSHRLIGIPF